MRFFEINNTAVVFYLDGSFLQQIARSWPGLSCLRLIRRSEWGMWKPDVNLTDVLILAQAIPSLYDLYIDIDFNCHINELASYQRVPYQGEEIQLHVNVGYAVVDQPEVVGTILSRWYRGIGVWSLWEAFGITGENDQGPGMEKVKAWRSINTIIQANQQGGILQNKIRFEFPSPVGDQASDVLA